MPATPEFYRGKLKKSKAEYEKILHEIRDVDEDGFYQLVSWEKIEQGIEQLSWTAGYLSATIETFREKDHSVSKQKYEKCLKKIQNLLNDIKALQ